MFGPQVSGARPCLASSPLVWTVHSSVSRSTFPGWHDNQIWCGRPQQKNTCFWETDTPFFPVSLTFPSLDCDSFQNQVELRNKEGMSQGNVACCIQMQTVQNQMDEVRMPIIPGVTVGPCGYGMSQGKESLNTAQLTGSFHHLKHQDSASFWCWGWGVLTYIQTPLFASPRRAEGLGHVTGASHEASSVGPLFLAHGCLGNTVRWADLDEEQEEILMPSL